MQQQWIISWSDCDMGRKVDFIRQSVMANSVVGLRRSPKALPKAKCAPIKSWSLVVCCPSDPLQLSESQWNHYIWEVCSANWWDAPKIAMPAAGTGQQKGPSSTPWQCPTKSWMIWATKCFLIHHIHLTFCQPTTTFSSILLLFVWKTFPQPAGGRKCFPRVQWIPKAWILCYRKKQIYFLLAKCVDCNCSYFD